MPSDEAEPIRLGVPTLSKKPTSRTVVLAKKDLGFFGRSPKAEEAKGYGDDLCREVLEMHDNFARGAGERKTEAEYNGIEVKSKMVSILRHHGDDRDKFGTATAEERKVYRSCVELTFPAEEVNKFLDSLEIERQWHPLIIDSSVLEVFGDDNQDQLRTSVMKLMPGLNARQLVYFWCHRAYPGGRSVLLSASCQHAAPVSKEAEDEVGTIERAKHYLLCYIIEPVAKYRSDEECTRLTSYVQLDLGSWVPDMIETKICTDLSLMLDLLVNDLCGDDPDARVPVDERIGKDEKKAFSLFDWMWAKVVGDEREAMSEGGWWGDSYDQYIEAAEDARVNLVAPNTAFLADDDKPIHKDWRPHQTEKKHGMFESFIEPAEDSGIDLRSLAMKRPKMQSWKELLGLDDAAMMSGKMQPQLTTETKRRASAILLAVTPPAAAEVSGTATPGRQSMEGKEWKGAGRRASVGMKKEKMEQDLAYKMKLQDPETEPVRRKVSVTATESQPAAAEPAAEAAPSKPDDAGSAAS